MPTPPTPGTVKPGELLVDAQTRALWLGVSATLDPLQALLVSDIEGLQSQLDQLEIDLKAYTDSKLALKSDVGHKHSWQDITTGTPPASTSGSVPALCLVVFSGNLGEIPAGWALCDGTQGTPNLTDKFIVHKGTTFPYKTGGGAVSGGGTTGPAGGHSHGTRTQGTAITVAQMSHHAHAVYDPGHAHGVVDYGHQHLYTRGNYVYGNIYSGGSPQWHDVGAANGNGYDAWSSGANQAFIAIAGNGVGIGIYGEGGNQAHDHGIWAEGDHTHTFGGANLPPYWSLAYIMKLPG